MPVSNYHIGQYIKKRREELNVNQDALCYGIWVYPISD